MPTIITTTCDGAGCGVVIAGQPLVVGKKKLCPDCGASRDDVLVDAGMLAALKTQRAAKHASATAAAATRRTDLEKKLAAGRAKVAAKVAAITAKAVAPAEVAKP